MLYHSNYTTKATSQIKAPSSILCWVAFTISNISLFFPSSFGWDNINGWSSQLRRVTKNNDQSRLKRLKSSAPVSQKDQEKQVVAFFNEERLLIGEEAISPRDMSPSPQADTHRNYFKHTHINMHALSLLLPTYSFPHKQWWLLHQEFTPLHSPWLSFSVLHFWFLQVIKSKNYLGYVSAIFLFLFDSVV